jgi:putative endonuclease
MTKDWFIYIILASDGSLYTGITTDVLRRWSEHLEVFMNGKSKGAKYFRGRSPEKLIYVELSNNRSSATRQEMVIKKLTKKSKINLIESECNQLNQFKEFLNLNE